MSQLHIHIHALFFLDFLPIQVTTEHWVEVSAVNSKFSLLSILYMKVKVKLLSHVWPFATPWTVAHQASLSMGFSRQEYWSGLSFPSPGDLPNPGIQTQVSRIAGRRFNLWATREVCKSQSPNSSHLPFCHTIALHICVSISTLQTGSSVSFF